MRALCVLALAQPGLQAPAPLPTCGPLRHCLGSLARDIEDAPSRRHILLAVSLTACSALAVSPAQASIPLTPARPPGGQANLSQQQALRQIGARQRRPLSAPCISSIPANTLSCLPRR